jgi:ADP-ribose pyrophosphatase YjhB (NUDIX family)
MPANPNKKHPGSTANPHREIPEGDTHERLVCNDCGFIAYENPKLVVGSVVEEAASGKLLLCRRAIEPGYGLWTLPAGYLELGESPTEGAIREALEEAGAAIAIDSLLGVYTIRLLSQVQLIFRAKLSNSEIEAGVESLEVRLFDWSEIPWDRLAFPSVAWALQDHRAQLDGNSHPPVARATERGSRSAVGP